MQTQQQTQVSSFDEINFYAAELSQGRQMA